MPATATLTAPSALPANTKAPLPVKSHAPHSTGGPSNVSLFLTSLRLLDLDKHPEWPGISRHTFSTKDAQQSQKNRIRCVEWALYRLFEIWDGESTANKLQPFFPPLEPLQSINLRAALFRCLSELKKDGVLGRDMVLRKTMLDECKGERFEELLAAFAAVVLKKKKKKKRKRMLLHKDAGSAGIGWQLSTATSLTIEEQSLLRPLVIAHRASLTNRLREREETKGRYEDFASLLELKRRQVVRREEELNLSTEEQKGESIISDEEGKTLRRQWQENWVGGEKLLDIVTDGDARPGIDELLSERYGLIWEKVEDGKLSEVENMREKTLLEELDGRVRDQKLRLEGWKIFRVEFDKRANEEKMKSKVPRNSGQKKQGLNLSFEDHKELTPGTKSPFKFIPDAKAQGPGETTGDEGIEHEYARLMQSMKAELAKVGKSRRSGGSGWRRNKNENNIMNSNARVEEDEDMSEISPTIQVSIRRGAEETSVEEVGLEETTECAGQQPSQPSDIKPVHGASGDEESLDGRAATVSAMSKPIPDGTAPTMLEIDSSLLHLEQPPKRLKNTRLSLLDPEGQELLAEQRESATEDPSPEDPVTSLLERTRKSMTVFQQAASTKSNTQAARPRKSIHHPSKPHTRHMAPPETPNKHDDFYGSDNSIPREELFSQEADYASVFKSRPKIALSPTFSPAVPGEDEELELPGFESSMVEVEDWEGGEESPSPLVRARGRERQWKG
ncbi:MAG: hypothetical protein M1813_002418 [Trichoglossum hirsutum]|nr:MAG: hypothetical protein M1813_002418 [Trichoglossum hirsutum]